MESGLVIKKNLFLYIFSSDYPESGKPGL